MLFLESLLAHSAIFRSVHVEGGERGILLFTGRKGHGTLSGDFGVEAGAFRRRLGQTGSSLRHRVDSLAIGLPTCDRGVSIDWQMVSAW